MSEHDPPRPPAAGARGAAESTEQAALTEQERAALLAWPTPAVSSALLARILDAAAAERAGAARGAYPARAPKGAPPAARGRAAHGARARWRSWGLVAAAAAVAVVTWQLLAPAPLGPIAGAVTATERLTRALGPRALAVLEPATTVAWALRGGRLEVEQPTGSAFYRVDKGSAFVVRTPAGEVRVTGTCFRVEVLDMRGKQALLGGAVGAAVAALAVITVYEGGVVAAGRRGETSLGPGQQAVIADGAMLGPEASAAVTALAAPPPVDASREQLLARDAAQRRRADLLERKVAQLEAELASAPRAEAPTPEDGAPAFAALEPSQEELVRWAKVCKVAFDSPPMNRPEPMTLTPEQAAAAKLSSDEVVVADAVLAKQHAEWLAQVRGFYAEIVGHNPEVESLSLQAMTGEIEDKGVSEREEGELRRRLAQERAGLARPPVELSKASPFERYFRALVGLGDRVEAALAKELGPERAHALRAHRGGWGMRSQLAGCPGEAPGR